MYERFKELMDEKGLTAYKVAMDTNISQSTLSDWKNGRITPKMDKLIILAKYFDVDLDYLMGNTSIRRKIPVLRSENADNNQENILVGDVIVNLSKAKKLSMPAQECLELFEAAPPEVREFVISVLKRSAQIPSLNQ